MEALLTSLTPGFSIHFLEVFLIYLTPGFRVQLMKAAHSWASLGLLARLLAFLKAFWIPNTSMSTMRSSRAENRQNPFKCFFSKRFSCAKMAAAGEDIWVHAVRTLRLANRVSSTLLFVWIKEMQLTWWKNTSLQRSTVDKVREIQLTRLKNWCQDTLAWQAASQQQPVVICLNCPLVVGKLGSGHSSRQ